MTDDVVGIVLVLLQEIIDTREGNLIDVLVYLLFRHTDTTVTDSNSSLIGIKGDMYGKVA